MSVSWATCTQIQTFKKARGTFSVPDPVVLIWAIPSDLNMLTDTKPTDLACQSQETEKHGTATNRITG